MEVEMNAFVLPAFELLTTDFNIFNNKLKFFCMPLYASAFRRFFWLKFRLYSVLFS
jgi:hypothetical protein